MAALLKKIIFFSGLLFISVTILAQKKYWQQQVDVNISVSLNDEENSLTGFEKINYTNNSPDTIKYIWFHLWPNAYKNDKTAFSDQMLENGNTDFYFSEENKKGYINQLNFKVNNINSIVEDHPQHQDIIKLILPNPLPPMAIAEIQTAFYVKLPYLFSRLGHINQSYQISQWYPKPAVYDAQGWHEIPYLSQGEFYSEFGNYEVQITLPENYIVVATGTGNKEANLQSLKETVPTNNIKQKTKKELNATKISKENINNNVISRKVKTLIFKQENVHDFAWFASKEFMVNKDTLQLANGKIVDIASYYYLQNEAIWKNSIPIIKQAILSKSKLVGEYPYNTLSIVDNAAKNNSMEYPTVCLITTEGNEAALQETILHEIGHQWFYGILANNERSYPWMDEGINTYYDDRHKDFNLLKNTNRNVKNEAAILKKNIPYNIEDEVLQTVIALKKDQPINTSSEKFSTLNYGLIAYRKAALWMKKLESILGRETFDIAMQFYYSKWKFKHPQPIDFKIALEESSSKNLDDIFSILDKKGGLSSLQKKQLKLAPIFNLHNTKKYHYISIAPSIGYNLYDKIMLGALIHNYNLPPSNFQFLVAPLFATGTSKMNGIARVEYNYFTNSNGSKLTFSIAAAKFTGGTFKDSTNIKNPLQFSKIVPSIKYNFANKNPRSTLKKYIQFKTFFIKETGILFDRDTINNIDKISYPTQSRYLNQLQFIVENNRKLYPYDATLQAEQGDGFVRLNFTGNYYFNYAKAGGLDVRIFAGKFIYTGNKSFSSQYSTDQYHLNLTGAKGYEDYTYSNYFIGRNEFEGFASQQIMNKDGFFKVRTDLLSNKVGRSDDWLSSINLVSSIPKSINIFEALPIKIPVKLFADIGTYADAWKTSNTSGRFLYDAGLQVSLFKNVLNIYIPLVYSKVYADYFKSTISEKRFQKNIAFTIDINKLKLSNFLPQLNF